MDTTQLPPVIRVPHIAKIMECSEGHVRNMDVAGEIPPSRKVGRLRYWSRDVFLRWIADGMPAVKQSQAATAVAG